MNLIERISTWLEIHWVNPAYGGWLMGGLALFFFGAATNTMAGWLYVISGLMAALLLLAAIWPLQNLRGLRLRRSPILPVSAGDSVTVEIWAENLTQQSKTLLLIQDKLPSPFGSIRTAIEQIPAQSGYCWTAHLLAPQRGIYHWQQLTVRTAAPLGLFWRQQSHHLNARAVVYPRVLKLADCPLIDRLAQDHLRQLDHQSARLANEGMTRTLRPYRWGDSTRLIHWRSSARYGDLRVRELETDSSGQELVIGLDSEILWHTDWFEQAVVAAASLYSYAQQRYGQQQVSLWTANRGLVQGELAVLEALAGVQFKEDSTAQWPAKFSQRHCLWLTQSANRVAELPADSRWLLWPDSPPDSTASERAIPAGIGLMIQPDQPLQPQLQSLSG